MGGRSNIGPYSKGELAPIRFISALYGANVVLLKQLMAAALANALRAARQPGGPREDRDGIREHAGSGELRGLGMERNFSEAYIVAPPEFALWHEAEPVTLDQLRASMIHWLAGEHPAWRSSVRNIQGGEFRRNARRCWSKLVRNANL
jgi:hypothetical protein